MCIYCVCKCVTVQLCIVSIGLDSLWYQLSDCVAVGFCYCMHPDDYSRLHGCMQSNFRMLCQTLLSVLLVSVVHVLLVQYYKLCVFIAQFDSRMATHQ